MPGKPFFLVPRELGLWPRLALGVTVVFVLLFAIFALASLVAIQESTIRILSERQVLAEMARNQVVNFLEQASNELEKATTFAPFDPRSPNLTEEAHLLAHTYGRIGAMALGVYFLDASGRVVMVEPADTFRPGFDLSQLPPFEEAIASTEKHISAPFRDPRTGKPALAITLPILGEERDPMGFLSGIIDLTDPRIIQPLMQAKKLGRTGHAEIVDRHGTIIASTEGGHFMLPGEHLEFYLRMLARGGTSIETVPYERAYRQNGPNGPLPGQENLHVMAFAFLPKANWGVALGGTEEETFAPVKELQGRLMLLGSLSLAVLLVGTLLGARRLVRPIKVLTQASQHIAAGNLSKPIELKEAGEIGVLVESLEQMRVRLKLSLEEITRRGNELEMRVKERTRELEQRNRELARLEAMRALDQLKAEFISSISHELRTPLGFIKGYATTLLRQDIPVAEETRREFLGIICEETENLQELVENLLDASRLQAGTLSVEKKPVNLAELVEHLLGKARTTSGGHHLVSNLPSTLPEVPADSRRIEQVMANLLDNAIKYSPRGGRIVIRGSLNENNLTISVADEGEGIPERDLGRIFDAFYRGDGSPTRSVRGTGLGLAICRGIVEAHGGRIWAESAKGRGTTVSFTLPLDHGASQPPAASVRPDEEGQRG